MKGMPTKFIILKNFLTLFIFFINPISVFCSIEKPDLKKGNELFELGDASRGIIACASCHGSEGNSSIPINPNLSGQSYEYLVKQLIEFQSKGEEGPIRSGINGEPTQMTIFVKLLSLKDIQDIAFYLSMQPLSNSSVSNCKETIELGAKIWRAGLPEKKVPACAACHSADGSGIPGQYPRLSGQFSNYLEEQLKFFRSGYRKNITMHIISDRMTDKDIKAVSDYAAGLR
ncbi:MAG: c-type cytochrome [Bordetella sp.]|nr:MAG: c-type cytochrome [Bordetella sp.]